MNFIRQYYFDFGVMSDNLSDLMAGFWITIKLSIFGGVLSLIWGLALAVIRQLPGRATAPLRWLSIGYIDAFRGIPLLIVLLLVSGGLSSLSSPIGGDVIPDFIGKPTWLGETSPFWYGVISLTITYGAYMAEVYRAGIEAVPNGQMEAARSIGMSHGQAMRFVIVPQAVRKVIPPLLNDFIALMKDTSLVSILGLADVVYVGRQIQSDIFNGSGLVAGAILFLIVTIPLARLVDYLIAREQRRTKRSGESNDSDQLEETQPAGGLPPNSGDLS
ncbi:MAG: amino acid ABC transporter permease [Solirubrobacterales bacterium]|nr:amino acid ABC transporter permease [Solirubrobacterales bacterium]MCB8969550.1 amino acid ABC transporter permease [Thermoleophilales bacterium]MCO5326607.1 amino acid ABC transporter permease [Solirubrobacterales bacterium]